MWLFQMSSLLVIFPHTVVHPPLPTPSTFKPFCFTVSLSCVPPPAFYPPLSLEIHPLPHGLLLASWLLCLPQSKHTLSKDSKPASIYDREHTIFVFVGLGYLTQSNYFNSIHLPVNFNSSFFFHFWILFYYYIHHISISTHLLMDIWTVSIFWVLWICYHLFHRS